VEDDLDSDRSRLKRTAHLAQHSHYTVAELFEAVGHGFDHSRGTPELTLVMDARTSSVSMISNGTESSSKLATWDVRVGRCRLTFQIESEPVFVRPN